jgi:pimeloyl-ACP methyl ester carboxylesterase
MRTGTLRVSDGTLETAWWGPGPAEAPTLVLLHEGLGSVSLWRDVPSRLAAATGWGVFAYSRFGYGNSSPTPLPRPMTYMHHEALVVLPQVLLAAGIERSVLVGHSDGGSIAAIYAGSPPSLSGRDPSQRPIAAPNAQAPGLLGLVTIAAHFFVEDLNIASIRQIANAYETGDLRQRLARYHHDVDTAFHGWNDAWLDPRFRCFDITAFLGDIRVPILALQGAEDPYGTDAQLTVFAARARTPIATRLIAAARHSPHLESKDATLAAITDFIAELRRGFSQ